MARSSEVVLVSGIVVAAAGFLGNYALLWLAILWWPLRGPGAGFNGVFTVLRFQPYLSLYCAITIAAGVLLAAIGGLLLAIFSREQTASCARPQLHRH